MCFDAQLRLLAMFTTVMSYSFLFFSLSPTCFQAKCWITKFMKLTLIQSHINLCAVISNMGSRKKGESPSHKWNKKSLPWQIICLVSTEWQLVVLMVIVEHLFAVLSLMCVFVDVSYYSICFSLFCLCFLLCIFCDNFDVLHRFQQLYYDFTVVCTSLCLLKTYLSSFAIFVHKYLTLYLFAAIIFLKCLSLWTHLQSFCCHLFLCNPCCL